MVSVGAPTGHFRRRRGQSPRVLTTGTASGALGGREDRHLALEAEDRPVHDRQASPDGGVVQEVSRREVVGAVDDHLPALPEDTVGVLRCQSLGVGDDFDVGIELTQPPGRRFDLWLAESGGRVQHLALEVRLVDDVVVDDAEAADPRRGEVERRR